ncbi:type I-E CRISPR-associated protein Cas5/CasD [Levilactobacillus bambusae]|uniref:Type I-E CRISPR-associated protein Cas5/CasD n=1 Tax=Levilactobacillus bambusae TaxID=2024736 RepID=A0A2V1N092_9LACO|nr:type I-E CRISPR-associated protein Cas5/CasD [Levilactobacillus bambusae]PWG00482.1 type I-E CRISPR-associated protein Cas5/CasD [Levilactobacillus bambusae]
MKTLTIRLTAPLQSYGNEANFDRRTTSRYPSKSAIIGMIAAALGYAREDARILDLNNLAFAVRLDQPGTVLQDYQTVEWAKDKRKVTYRDYIQDAVFLVAIGSENEPLINEIADALKHPYFPLFLGRRSNAPAGPLEIRVVDGNPLEVLENNEWAASEWYQKKHRDENQVSVGLVADANLFDDDHPINVTRLVKDQVKSFDQRDRQYGFRSVASERIKVENPSYTPKQSTQHDAMDAL